MRNKSILLFALFLLLISTPALAEEYPFIIEEITAETDLTRDPGMSDEELAKSQIAHIKTRVQGHGDYLCTFDYVDQRGETKELKTRRISPESCVYFYSTKTNDGTYCHLIEDYFQKTRCYKRTGQALNRFWIQQYALLILFLILIPGLIALLTKEKSKKVYNIVTFWCTSLSVALIFGFLLNRIRGMVVLDFFTGPPNTLIELLWYIFFYLCLILPGISYIGSLWVKKKEYYYVFLAFNLLALLFLFVISVMPMT